MNKIEILLLLLIIILVEGCSKKNNIEPLSPETKDSLKEQIINYSAFDLNRIAALNGIYIVDTLWEKNDIIGFKVRHPSNQAFYYSDNFTKEPLINSFVSLNTFPFEWEKYAEQSSAPSGRFTINSSTKSKEFPLDFSIRNWDQFDQVVKNFLSKSDTEKLYGHNDAIFSFYKYENLRLIFGDKADIYSLFKIQNKEISHKGLLYYSRRETISIRSDFDDSDFTNAFTMSSLSENKIARVGRLYYGKIGYMVLDAPDSVKLTINKLIAEDVSKLNPPDIDMINDLSIYFYLVGYNKQDIEQINSSDTNIQKIASFAALTIKSPQNITFNNESVGVPIYYELRPYKDDKQNIDFTINFRN